MKKISLVILLVILGSYISIFAFNITGLKVIQNVYNRPTGKDQKSDLTMTLINDNGDTRIRKIKQFLKNYNDKEKKIMFFLAPADVRNTSFMNWSYDSGKNDDQWIYLPALKKIKRISSDSKGDYFMGSDFTYDDLGDRHPESDTHKILREEKLNNDNCYVIESLPKERDYMYSRVISWVSKDKWLTLKKEFYDEDGDLLKVLTVYNYKKIKNYWIITDTEMKNIQNNHITKMSLKNIKLDTGISDRQFTERMMRRGV